MTNREDEIKDLLTNLTFDLIDAKIRDLHYNIITRISPSASPVIRYSRNKYVIRNQEK